MDVCDIEHIESCQQEMTKITDVSGQVYYYKKFVSRQNWWTMEDVDLAHRERIMHHHLSLLGIPVAPLKNYTSKCFVTHEVEDSNPASVNSTCAEHFQIGKILRKIHNSNIIHGDFHHDNIFLYNSREGVSAIIDFEETVFIDNVYPHLPFYLKPDPMYDLATFRKSIKHFFPDNYEKRWNSFMSGYGLPIHLTQGIEEWGKRIDERNKNFNQWCQDNGVENRIK
jgi:tRNA A-37 threonylcarbamoyl transferase component Bud32